MPDSEPLESSAPASPLGTSLVVNRRPAKSRVFVVSKKGERRRSDPCRLGNGQLKRSFATRDLAEDARQQMARRGSADIARLVPYPCEAHGWHLGNNRLAPWTSRVADREPALMVEVGERVVAQLLGEGHPMQKVRLRSIVKRGRKVPA